MSTETDTPDLIRDAQEIYRSGDRLAVVHWREGGTVRYHEQTIDQTFIPFSQFFEMPAERFEQQVDEHDAERVTLDDLNLPILNDA